MRYLDGTRWLQDPDNRHRFSCEASEARGAGLYCATCGELFQLTDLKAIRDRENEITHWEGKHHPECPEFYTVFND